MSLNSTQCTVVIPIDGSVHCRRAFDWYSNKVHHPCDRIVLVHVLEVPHVSSTYPITTDKLEVAALNLAEEMLSNIGKAKALRAEYESLCHNNGFQDIQFETLSARRTPGEGIVELATKLSARMIVIGNRGLKAVEREIMGSTSDFILEHSHCPVILVPPTM